MEPVQASKDFKVDLPPNRLWPVFSNTDQMNRAVDFDEVIYDDTPKGAVVRTAHSKLLGFLPTSWDEPPYEFVAERYYIIRRVMHGGPLASYSFSIRLHPEGEGTRLELILNILPRHAIGAWIATLMAPSLIEKMTKGLRGFADAISAGKANVFAPPKSRPRVNQRQLIDSTKKIKSRVSTAVLKNIESHLVSAADGDVLGMRPFVLADNWKTDRIETLRAFLHGSREGLLDLNWVILCPNCRISKSSYGQLSNLKENAHCDTCEIDFDGQFDQNVEVRFSVHPSIRKAIHSEFCIGSPSKSLHRRIQAPLGPKQSQAFRVPLENKRYFLRGLKDQEKVELLPDATGSDSIQIQFLNGCAQGEALRFKPGVVSITMENASDAESWCVLDGEEWADLGATAALVTTLQDFRDLFSSEVLGPNQNIAIKSLAIVFTDLKDSTATYSRIGDAKAYSLVRKHFEILAQAMRGHDGAIVKTIGDAVMAAFLKTPDAVAAAIAIQNDIAKYNETREAGSTEITVKLGIHTGPAIAVTMNDLLDYFGTTVNTAARVQGKSEGGDIVVTREILDCPGVQELLKRNGGSLEEFRAGLKGLAEDYRLWRFTPKSTTI